MPAHFSNYNVAVLRSCILLPAGGLRIQRKISWLFSGIAHTVHRACEVLEEEATGLKMLVCQALSALMSGLGFNNAGLGQQDTHNSCYFTTSAAAVAAAAVFKIIKTFTSGSCSFIYRAMQPTQTESEPKGGTALQRCER